MPINLPKILEGLGISTESVEQVRLRGGVVGKATYAIMGVMGVLGILAYKATPEHVIPLMWAVLSVFGLYFIGIVLFGLINPGAALLEGAELVKWKKIDLEAKSLPVPPVTVAISDPTAPTSLPLHAEEPDR